MERAECNLGDVPVAGFSWAEGERVRLEVCGKGLEAACHGPAPAQAPTVVLLHEGLGCLALWRDFPERLAEATGFGVFAYSRAGYGGSDRVALPRPLDYMTQEATQSLPVLLDALGLRQAILFGHSDGASIAAIHTGTVADKRVRGLVLMAPHFFTEASGLLSIAAAKEAYDTGDLRMRLAKYHCDVDSAFRGWNDAWLDPGFESWDIREVIDQWRHPVLAIQGAEDQYGTLAQIREIERRANCPLEVVIMESCRHSPHVEQPEKTISLVAGFTRRLLSEGGVDAI